MRFRELKGKGNLYRRVKRVITGEASSTVSTFSTGFHPGFYLHILFKSRLAQHNGGEFLSHFAIR